MAGDSEICGKVVLVEVVGVHLQGVQQPGQQVTAHRVLVRLIVANGRGADPKAFRQLRPAQSQVHPPLAQALSKAHSRSSSLPYRGPLTLCHSIVDHILKKLQKICDFLLTLQNTCAIIFFR